MPLTLDAKLEEQIQDFIVRALREDVGEGDHTSLACIPADDRSTARLLVKDPGIIAGLAIAERIFRHVDPDAELKINTEDGKTMSYGDIAFEVTCNTQALLKAERLVLNTMQRMSGIATLSNRFVFEVEDMPVKILDTRKTTPNLRFIEKWAVRLGGCYNYRDGLYDRIMLKDNHIDACGGIPAAIQQVTAYQKEKQLSLPITIEVRNLVELYEVLAIGQVDRIMLDNFELPILAEAVAVINKRFETEASGGVNIHTVRKIAQTGVNFISVGALTHSAVSLDLSLKVVK
ncbi:carboxylating nicotinate-nucleotide diphosphorylase [Lewinella cohaerens]|uniref:carboxylating nicotinate-nucleotide diphosphorylase n=1 Tax=Lewinella cohaerens TaxID=70995 RepID=UPI00036B3D31|nr:carboxylating nicotinate-nucleotide diphosphorylase [Lewinella cohaerens]